MANFRSRKSDESLKDYLKRKQAYQVKKTGKTGIDFGGESSEGTTTGGSGEERILTGVNSSYLIQGGDTLSGIADKLGVSTNTLMRYNPDIKDKNKIYAGNVLNVPPESTSESNNVGNVVDYWKNPFEYMAKGEYVVQGNDTLSDIAAKNNTTVNALLNANSDIADPNLIYPGQTIKLPAGQNPKQPPAKKLAGGGGTEETEGGGTGGIGGDGNNNVVVGDDEGNKWDVNIPEDLKNNEYFQQLGDNSKALVAYMYNSMQSGNQQRLDNLNKALKIAEENAEPFWKQQIRIAEDALKRSLTGLEEDLGSREKTLRRRIGDIEEDLAYNKDYLSAEKQSALAQEKRKYEQELKQTRKKMSQRGLSSSTIQSRATEILEEEHKDVVASTQRSYKKQLRSQKETAARQITGFEEDIEQAQKKTKRQKTTAVRSAEKYLGTEELQGISDVEKYTLGNIYGTIKSEKQQDILARAKGLLIQGL